MPALGRGEKIPPRDGEAWLTRLRLRLCSALSVIRRRNLCCNRSRRHHLPAKRETRWEEHTSELQSLMRTSYAVFCLQKKIIKISNLTLRTQRLNPYNNI